MDFDTARHSFLGFRVQQSAATGGSKPRIYLDAAATTLMPKAVWNTVEAYLRNACANGHTETSAVGRATTSALEDAHAQVGALVGAGPEHAVVLLGAGATEPNNLLAEALARDPARPYCIVSTQEHHSNLLPWIRAFGKDNVFGIPTRDDGSLDLAELRAMLARGFGRVRVVALTAVSNVTGCINPIHEVAAIAHAAGAEVAVDAAQALAHLPIQMSTGGPTAIDYLVGSGHKTYAPGSPGILVARRDGIAAPGWQLGLVGGGTVEYVGETVAFKDDVVARLEAGTPNIPGAVALGAAVRWLRALDLKKIRAHEQALVARALDTLAKVPDCVVYGGTLPEDRGGVITFNLHGVPYGLVAAALDDYFAIAVRGDCFCAQPYVRHLMERACDARGLCEIPDGKRRGMVRASFGVFTDASDIDALANALRWIQGKVEWLKARYDHIGDGAWRHKEFQPTCAFDPAAAFAASSR